MVLLVQNQLVLLMDTNTFHRSASFPKAFFGLRGQTALELSEFIHWAAQLRFICSLYMASAHSDESRLL